MKTAAALLLGTALIGLPLAVSLIVLGAPVIVASTAGTLLTWYCAGADDLDDN
jgi:hypothetical protein